MKECVGDGIPDNSKYDCWLIKGGPKRGYRLVTIIYFVGKSMVVMDIFLNYPIHFYSKNTTNLRHLTQRIMSCYTHKMAIVS